MPSWQKPTSEEVRRVAYLTARPEEQRYFFARLENPLWIDGLYESLDPPPPVTVHGGTRYPAWPVSQYIARVARSHPDHASVADVLAALASTQNLAVRRDLVAAMTALDPAVLTNLLPLVAAWVREPGSGFWARPEVVGGLAIHASQHDQNAGPVEEILNAYLEPSWSEPGELQDHEDARLKGEVLDTYLDSESRRAELRVESWDATEFADRCVAGLVGARGPLILGIVLRHLEAVLDRKFPEARQVNGLKQDYTAMWRLDLSSEEHVYDADDLLGYLAARIVDALAGSTPEDARATFQLLNQGGWVIHERLALRFLSRRTGDAGLREQTHSKLVNPDLANTAELRREYDELLRAAFANAGDEERTAILAGFCATAELEPDEQDRWLYERLSVISHHLESDWAERLENYSEQFGAPREPVLPQVTSWESWSHRSPLGPGEAGSMTATELAAFARAWALPEDQIPWERPNWRGLAEDIKTQVRARPSEFSVAAALFSDVNRTVVDALLNGLRHAVRDGDPIGWGPTLDLIKAIAPRDEAWDENEDFGVEQDSSWSTAKSEALDLIEAGLGSDESLALEFGPSVWEAIELLATHGAAPEQVELDGPRDSVVAALNATRSQAVYTAIVYAWWLRRGGVEGVPAEVDAFFRRILDPDAETFIGMRAAVAHRLPQLAYIDEGWAKGLLSDIFPDRDAWPEHWDAAWDAYVRLATPLPPEPVLEALGDSYAAAVQLTDSGDQVRGKGDPAVHLGMHLVLMFLHGMIELDHPSFVAYFERAPAAVRPRILDWIGRTAANDDLPSEWFVRARQFYEWRELRVEEDRLDRTELRKLGWFVAAGAFPREWWAPRLADALRAATNYSSDSFVPLDDMMGQVAAVSSEETAMAIDVLATVIEQNDRNWHEPYLASADTILAVASQHPDLAGHVRDVVDQLARAGHDVSPGNENAALLQPTLGWSPLETAAESVHGVSSLAAYETWSPAEAIPDPRTASQARLAELLAEVAAREGPVIAIRAYRLLNRASGSQRLTMPARRALNRACAAAERSGLIETTNPLQEGGQAQRVLRVPGHPEVVLRERGPRALDELPPDEVAMMLRDLRQADPTLDPESLKRRALERLGRVRLTRNASTFLDECVSLA